MAQAAKEKGNAAFKAGDYPTAVGHYSVAIHNDRNDATFPLNRAAAYLKLGKNEDAERDCDTVLNLSKGNVKALFRRAQARVALNKLDEAQADLNEAAVLEPANQSVKQELAKVVQLIQGKKPKTGPIDVGLPPKRRRVPITVVEPDGRRYPATEASTSKTAGLKTKSEAEPVMKPVSSRPLNASPQHPPTPTPAAKEKPASFKDAKSAREGKAVGKVGGGIFRASGESVLFKPREGRADSAPPPPQPVKKEDTPAPIVVSAPVPEPEFTPVKSPMSLVDFSRSWERAEGSEARYKLLCQIPPGALPALFQNSLEPALFVDIVDVLSSFDEKERAAAYLYAFARVPRFGTVLRFLSGAERERVKAAWSLLGVTGASQLGEVWGPVWR
ncbi:hypothetical protein FB45DRAFT_942195 [Roridomyces roridus]|uniref:RNA polymerase II-associated protein 3 n=1 Tax=Roridomyces roridus TaxID=1738132 RepID=A0AAD7B552_9AGAR|nr:hypothetical protein FB45DRAFT_942195 [Roridomyces roridus]